MLCKDCRAELPKSKKPNLSGRCLSCRRIADRSSNNPKIKASQAVYREKHREKRNAEKKAWYQANKAHKLQKDKEYREADPERHKRIQNEYWKNRYHTDINYKLRKILRGSLKRGLFDGEKSILEYLDCSLEEIKAHIESMFSPEMTWDNHGKIWDIDHIEPLCSFDLTDDFQIKRATRKDNLRPLIKQLNLLKSKEDRKWKR
jgi:hypothetical protein